MRWMLPFMALCAALAAPAGAQDVKSGIGAWQRGDYAQAVKIWRPLAEKGDADAAFNLGQAYRLGRGVPTNLAAAQRWLQSAAVDGHLDAQSTLGLLLFDSGDRAAGINWLRTAADRGEPRAMLVYGTALFNGDSVKRDAVLGYAYVSRAAARGLAPAKNTLADMDAIIPLADRKKGVAIAIDKATGPAPATPRKAEPKAAAKAATPAPPGAGGWRIQLGAFSKRSSAEALFKTLSARAPVAGKQMALVPVGSMTRLQVGPFASRAAAASACAALAKSGQACFPVAAK